MTATDFLKTNNKQVLEESKDIKLIENIYKLKKWTQQQLENCRKNNIKRMNDYRERLIEERVDEHFTRR